jgi:hypothetical protein
MNEVKKALAGAGYNFAVAIATKAEVEAGAACGQLAIINS